MNFAELLSDLQKLIKNKKIRQSDIARGLGTSTSNLSQKFNNPHSEVTISDVEKVQNFLGVQLYVKRDDNIKICANSKERYFDNDIKFKHKDFGTRILELKNRNNLSNIQMAGILNVSEKELSDIISGKNSFDLNILDNLKQNFKISIDWLLYGE